MKVLIMAGFRMPIRIRLKCLCKQEIDLTQIFPKLPNYLLNTLLETTFVFRYKGETFRAHCISILNFSIINKLYKKW